MKKRLCFCFLLTLVILIAMLLVSCNSDSLKGTEISLEGFTKIEDDSLGTVCYIDVPNSKIVFSLNDVVSVNKKSTWFVSTDLEGKEKIPSKTVELLEGNNVFFIVVEDEDSNVKQYTLLIRRRPSYTVKYYSSVATIHSIEVVEEGALATPPVLTPPTGYHFGGWSYDFSMPITSNVEAGVVWAPNRYVINYDANGGVASVSEQTVTYGLNYTTTTAVRPGYSFLGWYNGTTKITGGEWRYANDLTLVAKWSAKNYSISYLLDGGTNSSYNPSIYYTGSSVMLREPTRTGYTFIGWTYDGQSTPIKDVVINPNQYGDQTYIANWEANKYNVTFDANGGNCNTNSSTATYGNYTSLPTPTRTGYTFLGWYDGSIKISNNGYWQVAYDVKLTAKWKPVDYNITYILDSGSNEFNPTSYTITSDTFTLAEPVKEGYEFIGWTYEGQSEPVKLVTVETGSTGERVFTANWRAKSFTVAFDVNGGYYDIGYIESLEVTYDDYCELPVPYKTGHEFVGWYFNGNKYESGICKIAGNITLVAEWTPQVHTIFYVTHGGSVSSLTQTVTFGSEFTLLTPNRTGYTFLGWYYGEYMLENGVWTRECGLTLEAKWQANSYVVTYDANGGVSSHTEDIATYDSYFALATAERVGYTFVGWYDGTKLYTDGNWKTANTVKLVAKWTANTDTQYVVNHHLQNIYDDGYTLDTVENPKGTSDSSVTPSVKTYTGFTSPSAKTEKIAPDGSLVVDYYYMRNSYTISFVTNGGSAVGAQTYKYQETLNLPITERNGVTFGGWFTTQMLVAKFSNTTMPASDKTVYAWWQEENKPTDFTYTGTDGITISSYVGTGTTMWIPAYINDVPVTTIPASAFENEATLVKVVVPDTVTNIGEGAFKGCEAIEDITLPFVGASANATYYDAVFGYIFGYLAINSYDEENTSNLASSQGVSVAPSGNNYPVSQYVFKNGAVIQKHTEIWQYSCYNYYKQYMYSPGYYSRKYYLNSYYYYIPKSIKTVTITVQTDIPVAAFNNCDFIETINLPDTVESIGDYAFQNCNATINYFSTEE